MNIAIISPWYPSEAHPEFGSFVEQQAKALSAHHQVTVMVMYRSYLTHVSQSTDGNLKIVKKGIPVWPKINELTVKWWATAYRDFFLSQNSITPFDIIHCHDHYAAYAGYVINKQSQVPYVVTLHSGAILNNSLHNWQSNYLAKILLPASKVIAVSQPMADNLYTRYKLHNITIIPNMVDGDLFYIKKEKIPSKPLKLLFVGSLDDNKGVLTILEAVKDLDVHLTIVGKGTYESKVVNELRNPALIDKVTYIKVLPLDEMPAIYHQCHCLISFSKYETFGLSIAEAMSCGLIVIYFETGGTKDVAQGEACFPIEERSLSSLMQKISWLSHNYQTIDGSKNRTFVLEKFSKHGIISQLEATYKDVLVSKNKQ